MEWRAQDTDAHGEVGAVAAGLAVGSRRALEREGVAQALVARGHRRRVGDGGLVAQVGVEPESRAQRDERVVLGGPATSLERRRGVAVALEEDDMQPRWVLAVVALGEGE